MFVRQLHYFLAVAREGHFGRAAEACHVSQPTLSAGLRKLEEELGQPLVVRGHRFLGLTAEGERILMWAQRIVADYDGLKQELSGRGAGLSGQLRIGAVPATLPAIPPLVNAFCARHPEVRVQIQSLSSAAIQRGLDDLDLDVGVTYLDTEPLSRVGGLVLYDETYVFVTADPAQFADRDSITWREAAASALCLLTSDMQNRRIIDRVLAEAGVASLPRIEANSFFGIWSQVASGAWASIVPQTHLSSFGRIAGMRALSLVDPVRHEAVGLVASDRDPRPPVADAFLACARNSLAVPVPTV
ncbi:LysR family transcriptional regulator [Xanthobacter sp. DSM 24535]|uniref:LysR family transcriptional regulator n=1 Tax=Roseixanthobacter psychrophilus TaxID=3119917 RepID=UPI0037262542